MACRLVLSNSAGFVEINLVPRTVPRTVPRSRTKQARLTAHGLGTRPGAMVSSVQAGGDQPLPEVPPYKKRFTIETEVEVVQPAGSYSFTYTVGRLSATTGEGGHPAMEIISTAPTGPARYRLPEPFPRFTELMLPLLGIPEVRVMVQTFIPQGRAVTRALVVVELVRDTLPGPSSLRRLYDVRQDYLSSERCRRRQREDEQRRPVRRPELTPELTQQVRRC